MNFCLNLLTRSLLGRGLLAVLLVSVSANIVANISKHTSQYAVECTSRFASTTLYGTDRAATLETADCGGALAGEGYEVDTLFVHEIGKNYRLDDLAFRYTATSRGSIETDPPILRWTSPIDLTVVLRPDDIESVSIQKEIVNKIRLHYDIRFSCTAIVEKEVPNTAQDVAILMTSTCSSGSAENTYYLRSVLLRIPGKGSNSKMMVLRYKPTRLGAEFTVPSLRWKTTQELVITLKRNSIERLFVNKPRIKNITISYNFR